jgi:hypothetical protein
MIAGAAAASGVLLGAALVAGGYKSWMRKLLERSLPGYSFNPEGLDLFLETAAPESEGVKFRVFGAVEGIVDVKPLLPDGMELHADDEERRMLTEFILGSDFLEHYPDASREITYHGATGACQSPFATF